MTPLLFGLVFGLLNHLDLITMQPAVISIISQIVSSACGTCNGRVSHWLWRVQQCERPALLVQLCAMLVAHSDPLCPTAQGAGKADLLPTDRHFTHGLIYMERETEVHVFTPQTCECWELSSGPNLCCFVAQSVFLFYTVLYTRLCLNTDRDFENIPKTTTKNKNEGFEPRRW